MTNFWTTPFVWIVHVSSRNTRMPGASLYACCPCNSGKVQLGSLPREPQQRGPTFPSVSAMSRGSRVRPMRKNVYRFHRKVQCAPSFLELNYCRDNRFSLPIFMSLEPPFHFLFHKEYACTVFETAHLTCQTRGLVSGEAVRDQAQHVIACSVDRVKNQAPLWGNSFAAAVVITLADKANYRIEVLGGAPRGHRLGSCALVKCLVPSEDGNRWLHSAITKILRKRHGAKGRT